MTKKIISILIFIVMMMCPLCSLAADVSVVARYDAGVKVNLSGNAEGEAVVTLFRAEEDGTVPVFIRQFSADGTYSFDIQMPSDTSSGKYIVYVTTAYGKGNDSFSFINAEKSADALALLAEAESAEDAKSIAESRATDLGIDMTDENYESNSSETFKLLYNQGMNFSDASKFNAAYYKMFSLAVICGGDNETVENMLSKYQSQLGIDFEKDIASDEKLTEEAVERLYSVLSCVDFVSEFDKRDSADFLPILNESKITAVIDAATDWQGIKKAFEDFEALEALLSDKTWKKINDKDDVYARMMSYSYSDIKDVEEGFEKAVSYVYKKENPSSKVSGGGSSGGNSVGGVSRPVITPGDVAETFEKPVDLGFSDFDKNHWSYDAVEGLCEIGVIKGYEDSTFRPNKTISRAEFAKLIMELNLLVSDEQINENSEEIKFDDVSADAWYCGYVSDAAKEGLLKGDGNIFRPDDSITRQDAAVIIYRLVNKYKSIGGNKVFSDRGEISDYARDAVAALADSGLISGVGDNKFAPTSNLTRAQSAQLLWNALEFLK